MCGIVGVFAGHPMTRPSRELLNRCLEPLASRGPDHSGCHIEPGLGLGHTRLAVLELGDAANQPVIGSRGAMVYNGEVYNYAELAAALPGVEEGAGDTRVLHAWLEHHGPQADPKALDGMFALAYYDPSRDELLLLRDAFGQKPLYYAVVDGDFWFASDPAALRIAMGGASINPAALSAWFAVGATDLAHGDTLFEGIRVLPPGHRLRLARGAEPVPEPWHRFERQGGGEASAIRRLEQALRDRLVSEVPLGAMLSGGVDSALLVSMIAQHRSLDGFNTFAVGYQHDRGDLHWSRAVAAELGVRHHELSLDRGTYIALMDEAISALQAPLTFGNEPALLGLCKLARQHVTVVIGGEGADEAFGGYRLPFAASAWRRRAQGYMDGLLDDGQAQALGRSFGGLPPTGEVEFFLNLYHWFSFAERDLLFRDEFKAQISHDDALFAHVDQVFAWALPGGDQARIQSVFMKDHLGRLLRRLDAMSMRVGLEARAPFCAVDLVNLALSLPDARKLQPHFGAGMSLAESITGIEGKAVLRAEAKRRGLSVWSRPKNPFAAPFLRWFGPEHRQDWEPELYKAGGIERFIDPHRLRQYLDADGRVNRAFRVWQLYGLSRFLELEGL